LRTTPSEGKFIRWRVIGRVTLFFLSCAFLLAATSQMVKTIPGPWANLVLGSVAAIGAFALTVVFVRWEEISLDSVGAALARGSLPRFAAGFLAGLVLVAIYTLIPAIAGHVRWVRAPGNGFATTIVSLFTFLAISCREELAFRGYPLAHLNKFFGVWSAQIIVAVVFAAEHMAGGWPLSRALLGAGVGSLLFGMAAIATRGLAVPIGLHAAWNFGDWMVGGKGSPGLWQVVFDEGYQQQSQRIGTIVYITVMILATVALWIWYRSKTRFQPET
jgi:membrane protease YdiL (CAAX protease family)